MKIKKSIENLKEKIKLLNKKGFSYVFFSNFISHFLAFVTSLIVIRMVSKSDFAYYSYANNLLAYVISFSGFGLSTIILKYCNAKENKDYQKTYLTFALVTGLCIQLPLTILLFIIAFNKIPFEQAKPLLLIMFMIPFFTYIFQIVQNYYRSQSDNKQYFYMTILLSVFYLIFGIILIKIWGVTGYSFSKTIVLAFCSLIPLVLIYKSLKKYNVIKIPKETKKQFFIYGATIIVSHFLYSAMFNNELLLVNNIIANEVASANYKVAMLIPSQMAIISSSIMVFYFPLLAQQNNVNTVYKTTKKIQFYSTIVTLLIALFGILLSPHIIKLFYGNQYLDSLNLMNRFWLVYVFNNNLVINLNVFQAIGKTKSTIYIMLLIFVVHFLLDYFLITRYNINGVGYATAFVCLLGSLIFMFSLKKLCKKEAKNEN